MSNMTTLWLSFVLAVQILAVLGYIVACYYVGLKIIKSYERNVGKYNIIVTTIIFMITIFCSFIPLYIYLLQW